MNASGMSRSCAAVLCLICIGFYLLQAQDAGDATAKVGKVLPDQVAKLMIWKLVRPDASRHAINAQRGSIEWITKVIDSRWLPEEPEERLKEGLILLEKAYEDLDTSHVQWEQNGYRFRVSQTMTVFYLEVTPIQGAISEGDFDARLKACRELTERLIKDARALSIDGRIDEIKNRFLKGAEGVANRPGAPLMTNPRAKALSMTASLKLEELVWSLGERWTSRAYAFAPEFFDARSASWFAIALPNNIQVARLIEEGRRDPERVSALLQDRAMRICSLYYTFRRQGYLLPDYPEEDVEHPDLTINTFIKTEHEKRIASYDRKALDSLQIDEQLYVFPPAILFIMVNINDDTALDIVATILKCEPEPSRGSRLAASSNGILVWAVDAFLSRWREEDLPEEARPFLAKHRELTGGFNITPNMSMSSWTAAWDVNDIFVMMLNLDVSDVKTIDMVGIPTHLDLMIAFERREEILKNFLDLYNTTGRQWEAAEKWRVDKFHH